MRQCLCLSYPSQCISFIFGYGGAIHLVIRYFSEENYSICSCKFVVSMGGGEFMVFLHCHLEPLLWDSGL